MEIPKSFRDNGAFNGWFVRYGIAVYSKEQVSRQSAQPIPMTFNFLGSECWVSNFLNQSAEHTYKVNWYTYVFGKFIAKHQEKPLHDTVNFIEKYSGSLHFLSDHISLSFSLKTLLNYFLSNGWFTGPLYFYFYKSNTYSHFWNS